MPSLENNKPNGEGWANALFASFLDGGFSRPKETESI